MALEPDLIIMFGIAFALAIPLVGVAIDKRKTTWLPVLMWMDTFVALGVAVVCLGYAVWGVFWCIGIFMTLYSALLSFGGLWFALSFGRTKE